MATEQITYSHELDTELNYSFSRSSGPGGQNVNKVNTKVEIRFNISLSSLLSQEEKESLLLKLPNQINNDHELIIISQATRSQLKNKEDAKFKFYETINKALKPVKKRKAIRIPKSVKEKRLKDKKVVSEKKLRRNFREDI